MVSLGRFVVTLALLAAPIGAGGRVWMVAAESAPGVDFFQIQPAVDAAADGDTILIVRIASPIALFEGFEISGKSLTVVDRPAAFGFSSPAVAGPSRVADLAAGQTVVIRGLQFVGTPPLQIAPAEVPLNVEDCAGVVWLEDVRARSAMQSPTEPAALVEDCAAVILSRCRLDGNHDGAFGFPIAGECGLVVRRSEVHLHDCTVLGSIGNLLEPGEPTPLPGLPGRPAQRNEDSLVVTAGGLLEGGAGGDGEFDASSGACVDAGPGGAGVESTSLASETQLRATDVLAGPPGTDPGPPCAAPPPTPALAGPGSVTLQPGGARGAFAPAPVSEGEAATFHFTGEEGELVVLHFSFLPGPSFLPEPGQYSALSDPFRRFDVGVVPAGGELDLDTTAPILPRTCDARTTFVQGLFLDASTGTALPSSPSVGIVVGAGF